MPQELECIFGHRISGEFCFRWSSQRQTQCRRTRGWLFRAKANTALASEHNFKANVFRKEHELQLITTHLTIISFWKIIRTFQWNACSLRSCLDSHLNVTAIVTNRLAFNQMYSSFRVLVTYRWKVITLSMAILRIMRRFRSYSFVSWVFVSINFRFWLLIQTLC